MTESKAAACITLVYKANRLCVATDRTAYHMQHSFRQVSVMTHFTWQSHCKPDCSSGLCMTEGDASGAAAGRVQVARFAAACVDAKTALSMLASSTVHAPYSQRSSRTQNGEDRCAAPE